MVEPDFPPGRVCRDGEIHDLGEELPRLTLEQVVVNERLAAATAPEFLVEEGRMTEQRGSSY